MKGGIFLKQSTCSYFSLFSCLCCLRSGRVASGRNPLTGLVSNIPYLLLQLLENERFLSLSAPYISRQNYSYLLENGQPLRLTHSKIRCVSLAHLVSSPAHKGMWWWHTFMLCHFKVQTNTQECVNKHRRCAITTHPVTILQLTLNWGDANVRATQRGYSSKPLNIAFLNVF